MGTPHEDKLCVYMKLHTKRSRRGRKAREWFQPWCGGQTYVQKTHALSFVHVSYTDKTQIGYAQAMPRKHHTRLYPSNQKTRPQKPSEKGGISLVRQPRLYYSPPLPPSRTFQCPVPLCRRTERVGTVIRVTSMTVDLVAQSTHVLPRVGRRRFRRPLHNPPHFPMPTGRGRRWCRPMPG